MARMKIQSEDGKDPGRTLKDRKKQLEDAIEGDDPWGALEQPAPEPTPKPKNIRSKSWIKW